MARPRGPLLAYGAVLTATLLWGTLHPVGKIALRDVSPLQLVIARTAFTAVTLFLVLALFGRASAVVRELRTRPMTIAGLAILSFNLSSSLSMTGLSMMPASLNSLMSNTSPLMLAVGLSALSKRWPEGRVLGGLLLGFLGVGLLTWSGVDDLGLAGFIGVLLSLAGSAAWATYTAWSRREIVGGDPLALTTACAVVGAILPLALGAVTGDLVAIGSLSPEPILLLVYAGVVGTALTYALWMFGLSRLSATSVSAFQYVIPLSAVTLAIVWLGERATAQLFLGGIAILVGIALAQETPTRASERG